MTNYRMVVKEKEVSVIGEAALLYFKVAKDGFIGGRVVLEDGAVSFAWRKPHPVPMIVDRNTTFGFESVVQRNEIRGELASLIEQVYREEKGGKKKEVLAEEAPTERTFIVTVCVDGDLPVDAEVLAYDKKDAVKRLKAAVSDVEEPWSIVAVRLKEEKKEEAAAESKPFLFAVEVDGMYLELVYDAPDMLSAQRLLVQDCQATFGYGQWAQVEKKEGEPVYEALVNLDGDEEGEGVVIEFSASSEKEAQENIAGIKDAGWNVIKVSQTDLQRFRFTVETSCSSAVFAFYDAKSRGEAVTKLIQEFGNDVVFSDDKEEEV